MNDSEFANVLLAQGWCVWRSWLAPARTAALFRLAQTAWQDGAFRAAGIGREQQARLRRDIRGDYRLWLDDCDAVELRQFPDGEIESLRLALNAAAYLGLLEFESQFAVYPPGARYARHLDRFRDDDARVVSLVLYLNQDWAQEDGGELCLYPGAGNNDEPVRVLPQAGTLVGFLSAEVSHEVLPARRERFSLSGWYRRR